MDEMPKKQEEDVSKQMDERGGTQISEDTNVCNQMLK